MSINENTRREFLGKLGIALGGVVLGGIGHAQNALPNGYHFYRIFDANDGNVYPGYSKPNPVAEVTAAVMIGSAPVASKQPLNVIYFHGNTTPAFRSDQPPATFFIAMDYSRPNRCS
jgi:hypothetical protein